jgi:hypothetical protein
MLQPCLKDNACDLAAVLAARAETLVDCAAQRPVEDVHNVPAPSGGERLLAGYGDSAHSTGLSLTANPTIRRCSYGTESSNVITNSDAAGLVGHGDDGTSETCHGDSAGQSLAADPTIRRGSYSPVSSNAAANADAADLLGDCDDSSADASAIANAYVTVYVPRRTAHKALLAIRHIASNLFHDATTI